MRIELEEVPDVLSDDDLKFLAAHGWHLVAGTAGPAFVRFPLDRQHETAKREVQEYFSGVWPRPCSCGTEIGGPNHWLGHLALNSGEDHRLLVPEDLREQFRRYEMKVGRRTEWLPLSAAARTYDSGMVSVDFGTHVREFDGTVRPMEPAERSRISDLADEYSAAR